MTDLSLADQAWIVFALMVVAVLSMLAGVQIEKKEREEAERAREFEREALRQAAPKNPLDVVI